MDWSRHRRRIYAHLGVDVVWTPASTGIAAAAVRVYFQNPFQLADFNSGGTGGLSPFIDLVEADFVGLARGDRLTVDGVIYLVKEPPQPDGLGGLMVHLKGPVVNTGGFLLEDGSGSVGLEDGSGKILQE